MLEEGSSREKPRGVTVVLLASRHCLTHTTSLGSCRSSPQSGFSLLLLVSLESANEGVQSGLNDQPSYDKTSLSASWSIDSTLTKIVVRTLSPSSQSRMF